MNRKHLVSIVNIVASVVAIGILAMLFKGYGSISLEAAVDKTGKECDASCNANLPTLQNFCKNFKFVDGKSNKVYNSQCTGIPGSPRYAVKNGLIGKPCTEYDAVGRKFSGKCEQQCKCNTAKDAQGKGLGTPAQTKASAFQQWTTKFNSFLR